MHACLFMETQAMIQFGNDFELVEANGQWELRRYDWGYALVNPDTEDSEKLRFYAMAWEFGDQPFFLPEPTLAFDVPSGFRYVDSNDVQVAVPQGKVSGIICQDGPRFSLWAALFKGIEWAPNADGSVTIDDEVWWPATLLDKDKNRFRQFGPAGERRSNYDGYYVQERPDTVKVVELGDLNFFD